MIWKKRFGVCCVFILQSGSTTVTQNCTYIQNENFPAALPNANAVQFMVQRCNNGKNKLLKKFLQQSSQV